MKNILDSFRNANTGRFERSEMVTLAILSMYNGLGEILYEKALSNPMHF